MDRNLINLSLALREEEASSMCSKLASKQRGLFIRLFSKALKLVIAHRGTETKTTDNEATILLF